jgi:hypothetical protein
MPPGAVQLLFKHFWVAFILVTFLNAAIWWRRGSEYRQRDPSLTEDYRTLIRGFVTWVNAPWLIMGAGILFGGVPSIVDYFNPRYPNLFVAAFFASIVFLWLAGTHWLFARGGAEQLVRCPGLFNARLNSPGLIKIYWLMCLAGGIAGLIVMFFVDFPAPRFVE